MQPSPGRITENFKNPIKKGDAAFFNKMREEKQFRDLHDDLISKIQTKEEREL